MVEDFKIALARWLEAGEKVVVFMDANKDIRAGPVADMFSSLGMQEQMQAQHPRTPLPATYIMNNNHKPIDGVWTNLDATEMECAYLAYYDPFPGDHRLMVLEVPKILALGYNPRNLNKKKLPDLTTSDPRKTKRYNKHLRKT